MRHPLAAVPVVVLLLTGGIGRSPAAPPAVGDRHPDFTLSAIADGKPKSLSDFRGKKVLLVQFASW